MQTVSMITDPIRPALDGNAVDSVRRNWGGGSVRWLNPGVAAEFDIETLPQDLWQVWEDLQPRAIDLAIQPAAGRRRHVLVADMDSTMIRQECIDELADVAGLGAHVAEITARAMNGELEFEPALRERVALLRGLDVAIIDRVIDERITFTPGGRELIATMKAHGAHTALVSGGFTAFTERVARHLGFDEHRANRLVVLDGRLDGTVAEPILGRQAKIDALREIATRLGITPDDVMAVGDGANDLGMLGLAGAGVALHAKPAVAARCNLRINHGDLTALLYLQGYSVADFVSP